MYELLNEIINSNDILKSSQCNLNKCVESDRIKWDENDGKYKHVRIDGVLINTNEFQKCDCLIFFLQRGKTYKNRGVCSRN